MRSDDAHTEQFDAVVTPPEKTRIAFVDIGRTVAALVVFYTHIANQFVEARYGETPVTDAFTTMFQTPLGLSAEGIGQIAIYFFFLVSGFIVTPIALKLGAGRFSVNRFFRIYPLNVFAVLLASALVLGGLHALTAGQKPEVNGGTLLTNLTLANFSMKPFSALVGVAWTLAVEVLFYALLVAVLPLLRRWVWAAIFVELDVVLVLVLLREPLGPDYGGFASQAAYLLVPIIGQIIWAGWHAKIHPWLAGGYLLAAWAIFVMAANLKVDVDYELRAAPIVFAVLVFYVGLGAESRLKQRAIWTALSERSYSLYMMHGLVALPIMHAIAEHLDLPIWLTVIIGVAATFGVVQLTYLLVERPSHNLGRRLSRRSASTEPAPAKPTPAPAKPTPAPAKPRPAPAKSAEPPAARPRRQPPRQPPRQAPLQPPLQAPNRRHPPPRRQPPPLHPLPPPPPPSPNGDDGRTAGRRTKGRHARP